MPACSDPGTLDQESVGEDALRLALQSRVLSRGPRDKSRLGAETWANEAPTLSGFQKLRGGPSLRTRETCALETAVVGPATRRGL